MSPLTPTSTSSDSELRAMRQQTIPALYINLDRDTARRAFMEEQFNRLGIAFQRIPAVDGKKLTEEEVEALRHPVGTHRLAPPEMACNLSHLTAWKMAAESDAPFTAIFEDDVLLSDDFARYLQDADWIPKGADIVKVETFNGNVTMDRSRIVLDTGRTLSRMRSAHLGAGGYILSRSFARKLVAVPLKWGSLADVVLFYPEFQLYPDSVIWQLEPAACIQQQHHTEKFLPGDAPESNLAFAREHLDLFGLKSKKLVGGTKLWRELTRPFRRPIKRWPRKIKLFVARQREEQISFRK